MCVCVCVPYALIMLTGNIANIKEKCRHFGVQLANVVVVVTVDYAPDRLMHKQIGVRSKRASTSFAR